MDLGVRGKPYVVLGGSRGMGFEAACVLAAEGAKLVLISRSKADIEAAARHLANEFGVEAIGLAADASVAGQTEAAIAAGVERFGVPAGLLITSGLTYRNGNLLEASDEDWEANFQDVLMGHVRACRAVVPHMITAGGGTIVNTAAYSGRIPKTFLFPYASQKAAVINLTKNLALTYGRKGIRVNCVCPGAFETVRVNAQIEAIMAERSMGRAEAAAWLIDNRFGMKVAMRRPGKPREAGELMAFLLSERAGYLNGAIINIDGGSDFY
jgi:3-oxoacyl-[acyl-carrier protein] reductase